ncbi:MAG: hypothetical protein KBC84_00350 [Proteobacteria bacterium]|nr:hypothetical protein [Pseudomonadota bacterium]
MDINSLIIVFFSFAVTLFCCWYLLSPIFKENAEEIDMSDSTQAQTELIIKKRNIENLLEDLAAELDNKLIAEAEYLKSKSELELQLQDVDKELLSKMKNNTTTEKTLVSNG